MPHPTSSEAPRICLRVRPCFAVLCRKAELPPKYFVVEVHRHQSISGRVVFSIALASSRSLRRSHQLFSGNPKSLSVVSSSIPDRAAVVDLYNNEFSCPSKCIILCSKLISSDPHISFVLSVTGVPRRNPYSLTRGHRCVAVLVFSATPRRSSRSPCHCRLGAPSCFDRALFNRRSRRKPEIPRCQCRRHRQPAAGIAEPLPPLASSLLWCLVLPISWTSLIVNYSRR